ncbi:MAG TPA: ComE operon protein 2, partial [Solibacillus sp.]
KANVQVVHIPFDEAKIDFLQDEKFALTFNMLEKMRALGASHEELLPFEEKMHALFGKLMEA